MSKKVLFYSGGFAPVGGIEVFAKNLLSFLQAKGCFCTLICWGSFTPLLEILHKSGVRIVRCFWRWGCRWRLPDLILLFVGIFYVRNTKIVLFGKPLPGFVINILRRTASRNSCFILIIAYRPLISQSNAERKKLLEELNLFDEIWVQAKIFKNDLLRLNFSKRIEIVPYLLDNISEAKPFGNIQKFKIGYLGRLVPDKNLSLLLKSFSIISNFLNSENPLSVQDVSLHLFGDGFLRSSLEKEARDLKIEKHVHFHGIIPQEEVKDAIASCHLFVFTSIIEGQVMAALEILASGRPLVASNAGAFPEILSDNRLGECVATFEAVHFKEAIIRTMKKIHQQDFIPELIQAAYLDRFSPVKVGQCYRNIIDNLLAEK